ncbi:DUF2303 family protein [Shimia sagamensis]|uniref:Uncharacterized conserved protein n=1 Tax=Shimia sagamensis TaxID=1566352 RepID=A0ABY1PDG1_9RHOB|nr:DUF2303 family protein [Shimia sagamensis]SMP31995.1 Uncharacterized conserved protein [Shimia sagamensis]
MSDTEILAENPAETMRKAMETLGSHADLSIPDNFDMSQPHLVVLPDGRKVEDLTEHHRKLAEFLKPMRRKGTANPKDLQSFIDWSNRFKGDTSAIFANPVMSDPSLTCIADYHAGAPADVTTPNGDPSARHCHHKAIYNFPLSDEWKAWMEISGQAQDKDVMGEFIESHALDVVDPTPALIKGIEAENNQPWENRLIEIAQKLEGRFGKLAELLSMSRQFQVHETSNLSVKTNRDSGEQEIQFLNEHKDADGQPLKIPNLITIAIPVFLNGAPYRMAVRFRYRKSGSSVKFIMSVHNPEKVFEAAFDEAVTQAHENTKLPVFVGTPES